MGVLQMGRTDFGLILINAEGIFKLSVIYNYNQLNTDIAQFYLT